MLSQRIPVHASSCPARSRCNKLNSLHRRGPGQHGAQGHIVTAALGDWETGEKAACCRPNVPILDPTGIADLRLRELEIQRFGGGDQLLAGKILTIPVNEAQRVHVEIWIRSDLGAVLG